MTGNICRLYLAGAINAKDDATVYEWRNKAKNIFKNYEIVDPTRRDYRGKELENVDSIVNGDKEDILSCDIILAMCPSPSWGTGMEIIYASERGKRVVVITPNILPHKVSPWLRYHSEKVVNSLEEAYGWIESNKK